MTQLTINQVLHTGGWFWYRGKVTTTSSRIDYTEEVIFVPYPNNQAQPDYWVIPFYGEWLSPWSFDGEWYGPLVPPWKSTVADWGISEEVWNKGVDIHNKEIEST